MINIGWIGWDAFFTRLSESRICLISGPMGTGKTLMSVAITYELLKRRNIRSFTANFPCQLASPVHHRRHALIVDEAGVHFNSRLSYKDKSATLALTGLTAYLRKGENYVITPTYLSTDAMLRRGLRVWRTVKIPRIGWLYFWESGEEDTAARKLNDNYWRGRLILRRPSVLFGAYDTYFQPGPNLTAELIRQFAERMKQNQS